MKRLLTLALATALLACQDQGPVGDVLQQRAFWRSRAVSNYNFVYSISCFCISNPSFRIEVRNGVATRITKTVVNDITGQTVTTLEPADPSLTMEWIFEQAIAAKSTAEAVTFKFDGQFGYPTRMNVDMFVQAADDEMFWTITMWPIGK